jgi:hypothetical protein
MSGPILSERKLRFLASQSLDVGRLPILRVSHLDAGYGRDRPCSLCELKISRSQVEYEVLYVWKHPLQFHIKCFAVWQLECALRTEAQSGSPPGGFSEPDESGEMGGDGDGTPPNVSAPVPEWLPDFIPNRVTSATGSRLPHPTELRRFHQR